MESRVAVLRAVADALFPAAEARAAEAAAAGDRLAAALFRHSGACDEVLYKATGFVIETIEVRLTPEAQRELSSFGLPSAFPDLPRQQREAVLQAWYSSPDARMRKAFKGLKSLLMSAQFTQLSPDGTSDLLAAMRYPVTDPQRPPAPAPAAIAAEAAVAAALVDLAGADASPGSAAGAGAALAAKGLRVAWPGDYGSAALAVQCDVVVVGSGAGGGVAAANLAAAGLRVVVLEKNGFVPARDMTLQASPALEGQAFQAMYEQGGILSTEDASLLVLAGSTLGGGTRINWCASFETAPHVRREWAERHGLPDFASPKYDEAQDAVCRRLGVRTGGMCSALRGGLEALGVHSGEVPRNCLSPDCGGHCCLGCARGHKQDSVNTWLADACQAGARIITGAWAERLILEPNTGEEAGAEGAHERRRRTAGVLAVAGSASAPLRLAIQAPVVVSCAGSIHSPALLLRSDVSCRGAVGSNLRLHPCTCVVGLFPPRDGCQLGQQERQRQDGEGGAGIGDVEDLAAGAASRQRQQQQQQAAGSAERQAPPPRRMEPAPDGQAGGSIRCWEGALMSVFSNDVGDWEGSGYGSLLYTPAVHPAFFAGGAPWVCGEDYKELMLRYPEACVVRVLVRDQDAGRVTVDRSGRPRIHYTLSKRDEASMVKGVELGLRCMAAAGATAVLTLLNSPVGRFTFTHPVAAQATGSSGGSGGLGSPSAGAPTSAAPAGGGGGAAAPRAAPSLPGSAGGGEEFERYLADVARAGIPPLQTPQFSAHQMGTCRLGGDPKASVLDPQGECWDVSGLYCLDGSTFPTPTGLNPMIRCDVRVARRAGGASMADGIRPQLHGGRGERGIEAISYMLSKQLAARLAAQLAASGSGRRGAGSGDSQRSAKL
ncbi:hypothetical protein CHLNCDRAFT_137296 [Chlorella variabilis]|uniref:long-chain-alcohol oxidase n=1 Tax=Chlorella variabilis TaxID=554065 RepID=E1ZM45_CHLVA|nr:hypothetical protein CHLNCDRAFT_137296 [Chlorella variabilis]EFN52938.1 hypothetical protein CHLNCDRAFT_137296 [Chlorella variabilis]|eukprot:XP_005845040.1 hypothetical protein CHLNCDRAFT_137296 [Chlorella variabilis]